MDPSVLIGSLIKLLLSYFPQARIKLALSHRDGEFVHTPWKIGAATATKRNKSKSIEEKFLNSASCSRNLSNTRSMLTPETNDYSTQRSKPQSTRSQNRCSKV